MIVQAPATPVSFTVLPGCSRQIAGVPLVKPTGRPDEAVALIGKGGSSTNLAGGCAKVIVWLALFTVNVALTRGASIASLEVRFEVESSQTPTLSPVTATV